MMYNPSRPVKRWLSSMPKPQDPPARPIALSPFAAVALCVILAPAGLFGLVSFFDFIRRICQR